MKSNGGQESNLLLPSVVLTLNAIYGEILAAVQQVSITIVVPCTCTSITQAGGSTESHSTAPFQRHLCKPPLHKQEVALIVIALHLSSGTFAHPYHD